MATNAKMAQSICDESDVPPLEDMTEALQLAMQFKEHKSTSAINAMHLAESQSSNNSLQHTTATVKHVQTCKVFDKSKPSTAAPMKAQSFGGMKKGFLFGGGSKSTKASSLSEPVGVGTCSEITTHEDLPFIKPSNESSENRFQFDEVQQAMKVNDAFLTNKDWLTDDLLKRIQSNADLSQRLQDPTFMHAITEFQTNPQAAMYKYRDNVTMQTFFKDFCALLGDHFTSLASNQPPATTNVSNVVQLHSPEGAADITVARQPHPEESRVQEILADTELREILLDSKVQKLLEALRTDPEKAQSMLQQSDTEQRYKINRLIDAGLLQFQH